MHHKHRPKEAMVVVVEALNDPLTHLGKLSIVPKTYVLVLIPFLLIVLRPRLQKRLARIEKQLKIPEEDRHICEATLRKATEVTVQGERIYAKRAQPAVPITSYFTSAAAGERDGSRSRSWSKETSRAPSVAQTTPVVSRTRSDSTPIRESSTAPKNVTAKSPSGQVGTHSVWKSTVEEGGEIGVEEVALEHYAKLGYKGSVPWEISWKVIGYLTYIA